MAALRDQAKTSLPRVLRNTLGPSNNSLDADKEQFEREQLNAVTKALVLTECPVKEKHVRTIIIGTFKQKNSITFWNLVSSKAPLHGNPIVCWKFLHILHKILREGHQRSVHEALRHKGLLEDLGKLWGHLKEGYGMLISLYCKLIVFKLDFHQRNPDFPGNLSVDKETLVKIGNNDAGNFYELCIDFLDYMDEILALQLGVFSSLDMSKSNSMTSSGQCRLAPLIVCIQDSVHLYDYSVKLLFLLHQHLPPDTLSGHTSRFLAQFKKLRTFYLSSSNLQYFKHLVTVPSLPDTPPNFLVASELSSHVTPVAVVPEQPLEEEQEQDTASQYQASLLDERERYIDQLLAEVELLQVRVRELEGEKISMEGLLQQERERLRGEVGAGERLKAEVVSQQQHIHSLTTMLEEAQQVSAAAGQEQDKTRSLEEKFSKLKEAYQKLRGDHIALLRQKAEVDKKLTTADIGKREAEECKTLMEGKVSEVLQQMAATKESLTRAEEEQSKQLHNLQATNTSVQAKLADRENESRQKEETIANLELRLSEKDVEIHKLYQANSLAEENKQNLDIEVLELGGKCKDLEIQLNSQREITTELKQQVESKNKLLGVKLSELNAISERNEGLIKSYKETALSLLSNTRSLEDIESLTCSGYTLLDLLKKLSGLPDFNDLSQVGHLGSLAWSLALGVSNTTQNMDLGEQLVQGAEALSRQVGSFIKGDALEDSVRGEVARLITCVESVLNSLGGEQDLALLVQTEIQAMDRAIEEAAVRIEKLLEHSRAKDSGQQLEVNSAVLESCTGLVSAIRELVSKAKGLQKEIVAEQAKGKSDRDFYKKNSRWTEGLISAAKAVGLGAKLLVDAADRLVEGEGRGSFEELTVASQEISGSTAQLVIASRVKAREGSNKFEELRNASKVVTEATGNVVAVAKSSNIKVESASDLDFSKLNAHQSKTLEMETQVRLLKLESQVDSERRKLSELRRQNYKTGTDGAE